MSGILPFEMPPKQGANDICILSVHGATDSYHAGAVGVKQGALLVQRGNLSQYPICKKSGGMGTL